MSELKRLIQSAWPSALDMQLTGGTTEEARHPRRRACGIAIPASCVPVVLVDNIVKFGTTDTWWRPALGAVGERV